MSTRRVLTLLGASAAIAFLAVMSLTSVSVIQGQPTDVALQPVAALPPATFEEPAFLAQTTLIEPAPAGIEELIVASAQIFAPGDVIRINPGGATEEDNQIVSVAPLVLARPLRFSHVAGEIVVKLGVEPGSFSPEGLPAAGMGPDEDQGNSLQAWLVFIAVGAAFLVGIGGLAGLRSVRR